MLVFLILTSSFMLLSFALDEFSSKSIDRNMTYKNIINVESLSELIELIYNLFPEDMKLYELRLTGTLIDVKLTESGVLLTYKILNSNEIESIECDLDSREARAIKFKFDYLNEEKRGPYVN